MGENYHICASSHHVENSLVSNPWYSNSKLLFAFYNSFLPTEYTTKEYNLLSLKYGDVG